MIQKYAEGPINFDHKIKLNDENYFLNENKLVKKNIFYFHNACTQYKFNFTASDKIKNDSNWYEDLEKSDKIRNNRNSNLIIFGLTESIAIKKEERDKADVHLFFELTKELNSLSDERINEKLQWTINETRRLNPKKEILGPAPLLIKLGGFKSQLIRNQTLKAAKKLKTSINFKNVSISPDLTVHQRSKLKELNALKKELNDKLGKSLFEANYYYGVRNNKIVKIKKDLNIEIDTFLMEKRLKDLSEELIRHKASVSEMIKNSVLAEEFRLHKLFVNDSLKKTLKTAANVQLFVANALITTEKLLPIIKLLQTGQKECNQRCIAYNNKSNETIAKSSLVSCSFIKAIYSELSTDDSTLTNMLEDYMMFLKSGLT